MKKILMAVGFLVISFALIVQAQAACPGNLIVNGDFESGNTGFINEYSYKLEDPAVKNELWNPKTYSVGVDPNLFHSSWLSFGDHTSGSGNMMIVNATCSTGGGSGCTETTTPPYDDIVWTETVTVSAGTTYVFSYWLALSYPTNPPLLQVSINNTEIGTFDASNIGGTGIWANVSYTWFSGSNTLAAIKFVDQRPVYSGDDYVLDDISLLPIYCAEINIKPGSDPNSINLCSSGTTPVTIWGSEDFDVYTIDIDQLMLASASVKTVGKTNRTLCSIGDVGSYDEGYFDKLGPMDSYDDLTCHFLTIELTGLDDASQSAELTIIGCDTPPCNSEDPGCYSIKASDSVNIVKDCE